MGLFNKNDIEKKKGAVEKDSKIIERDNKRMFKVIVKLVLFTVLNILLSVLGAEIVKLFVLPYVETYGKLSIWKILLNDVEGFRNSTYAKYCYICIGLWVYSFLNEAVLLIRTFKKIDCIKNDDCLSCEKYIKCRYKDIKVERGY